MNWIELLKILGPAVLSLDPKTAKYVPIVIGGIQIAEKTGKPGADKRAIALESVILAGTVINTVKGVGTVDLVELGQVAEASIDTVVSVTNLFKNLPETQTILLEAPE